MQQRYESDRAKTALKVYGAKKILVDLVNISERRRPNGVGEAQQFVINYGPIRAGHPSPASDAIDAARVFRRAWDEKKDKHAVEVFEHFLEMLFTLKLPGQPYARPAVVLDFLAGKWEPSPRSLAEHLALELVRSRKMLHRCERPECRRYLIKEFSRDRYCSIACSDDMRTRGQTKWALDHREELNARRRKPRREPRKRNAA